MRRGGKREGEVGFTKDEVRITSYEFLIAVFYDYGYE